MFYAVYSDLDSFLPTPLRFSPHLYPPKSTLFLSLSSIKKQTGNQKQAGRRSQREGMWITYRFKGHHKSNGPSRYLLNIFPEHKGVVHLFIITLNDLAPWCFASRASNSSLTWSIILFTFSVELWLDGYTAREAPRAIPERLLLLLSCQCEPMSWQRKTPRCHNLQEGGHLAACTNSQPISIKVHNTGSGKIVVIIVQAWNPSSISRTLRHWT